jgi:dTDP-4-amino-4,6-dideoxygalactose transaminase
VTPGSPTRPGPPTIEERAIEALDAWRCRGGRSSSSVTASGAFWVVERWFADLVGHQAAFAVASGTQALVAALSAALTLRPGLVALPGHDWSAARTAASTLRSPYVCCDVGEHGVITPGTIAALPVEPAVIVATDLYGYPVDVAGLHRVAPGAIVVEDCSQAVGARRHARPAGSDADLAVWSLGSGKMIDAGEGGIVSAAHHDAAELLSRCARHPAFPRARPGSPIELSIGRMHPVAAVIAAVSLEEVGERIARRLDAREGLVRVARYHRLAVPLPEPGVGPAWHHVTTLSDRAEVRESVRIGGVLYPDPISREAVMLPGVASWCRSARSVSWSDGRAEGSRPGVVGA